MRSLMVTFAALAAWGPFARAAEPVAISDPKDKRIVAKFLQHSANVPRRLGAAYCRKLAAEQAEGICWLVCPQFEMPLIAYRLTGDAKHLDAFVQVFANMRSAMTKGSDGYLGWYGKALGLFRDPKHPDRKVDVIISGFHVVAALAEFLEVTAADPALAAKYATQRDEYLDLAANHLVKKWDARGRLVDLGRGGAVYRTHAHLRDVKASLTQPHNKHAIIGRALLALHRVTGKDDYMRRAVRLGVRFKRCLTLRDGHYEWNYWDPAGAWDVHVDDAGKWKHWIGREHRAGYYALSLSQAVALYHHGVVFDRADIDRFVKTQMEMCWNGDFASPKWYRVDRSRGQQSGAYICPALAPFDAKIRRFLYTGARQDERLARADHSWQGGPVARGWLLGKYVHGPAAAGGKPIHAEVGRRFRSKPENARFLRELEFEVTGKGYAAPPTPARMKPMPKG